MGCAAFCCGVLQARPTPHWETTHRKSILVKPPGSCGVDCMQVYRNDLSGRFHCPQCDVDYAYAPHLQKHVLTCPFFHQDSNIKHEDCTLPHARNTAMTGSLSQTAEIIRIVKVVEDGQSYGDNEPLDVGGYDDNTNTNNVPQFENVAMPSGKKRRRNNSSADERDVEPTHWQPPRRRLKIKVPQVHHRPSPRVSSYSARNARARKPPSRTSRDSTSPDLQTSNHPHPSNSLTHEAPSLPVSTSSSSSVRNTSDVDGLMTFLLELAGDKPYDHLYTALYDFGFRSLDDLKFFYANLAGTDGPTRLQNAKAHFPTITSFELFVIEAGLRDRKNGRSGTSKGWEER